MIALTTFCYIFLAYGITNMFVYAEGPWGVFAKIRKLAKRISSGLGDLFSCMMCFSTWIGLILSIVDILLPTIVFTPFNIILFGSGLWWLIPILDAGFTSGMVWLIHNFEEACERHGAVEYDNEDENEEE